MKQIIQQTADSAVQQSRAKIHSRASNKFRVASRKPTMKTLDDTSYLFEQDKPHISRKKFQIKSHSQLRNVLLARRDAYLLRGQTTRHTCVMKLIKNLLDNLKANASHEQLHVEDVADLIDNNLVCIRE